MDRKYKLNCRVNTNIVITNFWTMIAEGANKVSNFASKHAERRIKRNIYLAKLIEKENYLQSFETQLASISKECGHS